jgi:hypothetical protein
MVLQGLQRELRYLDDTIKSPPKTVVVTKEDNEMEAMPNLESETLIVQDQQVLASNKVLMHVGTRKSSIKAEKMI